MLIYSICNFIRKRPLEYRHTANTSAWWWLQFAQDTHTHTHIHTHTNGRQTDWRPLPSTLSPCFAVDNNNNFQRFIKFIYIFSVLAIIHEGQYWHLLCFVWYFCTLIKELWNPLLCLNRHAKLLSIALWAHSDLRKASGFVITTEPLGFVQTKQVGDFLMRVYQFINWCINNPNPFRLVYYILWNTLFHWNLATCISGILEI